MTHSSKTNLNVRQDFKSFIPPADLKLKLDVTNTELKQEKLVVEELGTELKHMTARCDQLAKALQEKDDECKQAVKKLRDASAKVIDLEKNKAVTESQVSIIKDNFLQILIFLMFFECITHSIF